MIRSSSARLVRLPLRARRIARGALGKRTYVSATETAEIRSDHNPKPVHTLPSTPSTSFLSVTHPVPSPHQSAATQETLARAKEFILPVYARPDIVVARGKGSRVWDADGREYLDFTAGIAVNALGHADEGVAEALREQASTLLHASNAFYNAPAAALAERLVTLTQRQGGLGYVPSAHPTSAPGAKVFFSNSGTEANEGAIKIARMAGKVRGGKGGKKNALVCFEHSFHGRSLGALSVTQNAKYQTPFEPLIPGVRAGKLNDHEGLKELIDDDVCGVILEPIQGEGGVNAAEVGWVREVVRRAREVGAVVVFDEIQCGLYRTGTLWAHSTWPADCQPDVITMAKPLANGYPIGAVLVRDAVAEVMTAGSHGTTFGGSPLACAVGLHVLSRLSDSVFLGHAAETSAYLLARLEKLAGWFPGLVAPRIRGRGLILGLVLPREGDNAKLVELARERGLLLLTAGKDCVRLVPSLNVGVAEVEHAVDVIESCLSVMAGESHPH